MEHLFVPLWESFDLKQLGFDEECLGWFINDKLIIQNGRIILDADVSMIKAPTYDQAFKWFRDKKILGQIIPNDGWDGWRFTISTKALIYPFYSSTEDYDSYEKARLDCLKTMIRISKTK